MKKLLPAYLLTILLSSTASAMFFERATFLSKLTKQQDNLSFNISECIMESDNPEIEKNCRQAMNLYIEEFHSPNLDEISYKRIIKATFLAELQSITVIKSIENDNLIGFILYGPNLYRTENSWDFINIAVSKKYRRKGFATKLMQIAAEDIKKRGGTHIELYTGSLNKPAHALYKKLCMATNNSNMYDCSNLLEELD